MNVKFIERLVLLICFLLIINPVVGVSDCGPSKGPISSMILNVNLDTPIISDSQSLTTPNFSNVDDNNAEPTNFLTKGNEDLLAGRYQEAIEAFDKALIQDKNQPDAWNGMMSAYLYLKKYNDVISLFQNAKDIIPDNSGIWVNKGRAEYYSGNMTEAYQSADMALGFENQSVDALVLKANTLVDLGEYEDALVICDQILSIDPNNQEVWYVKGVTQFFNTEYAKSIDSLEKDLKFNPDRICSYFYLSLSKKEISGVDSALEVLEDMADQFPPENTGAHAELAGLLSRLIKDSPDIDLEKTVTLWKKVFLANSTSEQDYYNEFREGRWSLISSALYKYIRGDIGSLDSINSLVDPLLTVSGDLSDKQRDEIVSLYSRFLNQVYANMRSLEAIEAADKILNLDPDNKSGSNDFVLYRKAFALVDQGRYQEALEAIEEALRINPDDDSNWEYKGDILKRLGREDEAREAYDTAKTIEEQRVQLYSESSDSDEEDETVNNYNTSVSTPNYSELLENAVDNEEWDNVISIAIEAEDNFHRVDGNIYRQLGTALQKLGRTEEALNAFDNAIMSAVYPSEKYDCYTEKGQLLFKLGRYDEAVAEFTKGAEFRLQVDVFFMTQDVEEFDKYMDLKVHENEGTIVFAGYPLYIGEQYELAYEAFIKTLAYNWRYTSTYAGISLTLEKLDRKTEAKEAWNIATDLAISDSFRKLANELIEENEDIRVLDAFSYATKFDPLNYEIWLEKGDYLVKNGKIDEAVTAYEKGLNGEEKIDNYYREIFNQENWDYSEYAWRLENIREEVQEKIDEAMKMKSS